MPEFRMPALGADMDTGTLVEWLVAPGDTVHRGDVVAVVDTEKSAIDVECFDSGVVERLLVDVGQTVPVGAPLAVIGDGAADGAADSTAPVLGADRPPVPPAPVAHPLSPLVRKRAAEAGVDLAAVAGTGSGGVVTRADVEKAATRPPANGRVRVSPYARRLAAERGLDPATLSGSGPDGAVHAADVPADVPAGALRRAAARGATAALMARSKREVPHYYLSTEIEIAGALSWLRQHNREVPVGARVLPAALLLRAVALAAREVPELNGWWVDDGFVPGDGIHLATAVSLRGGGLAAPVLHDADTIGVDALMERLRGAGERARTGTLRSSEVSGATLTVTNLGDQGVDVVVGVIHPPQVALVGFGATRRRPWADGDTVVVAPVVTASLSADHRATDGATGARFLRAIDRILHRPEELP